MERPNILLIISHDTGRHLGCYGRPVATPNLDRLAREGVLFTQAFCPAPQCCASRASLLTGRVPHRHGLIGLVHRGFRLRPDVPRLPALLARAGYATHLFGLQHEAPEAADLGYTHVHPAATTHCGDVAPLVAAFLTSRPTQPFFAAVGVFETHRPFPASPGPWDTVVVPAFLPDAPEIRRDIADLNLAVARLDAAVGQILAALDRAGLAERTLVLYTTDHGIAFPGAKATLFEPGIEIALIARGPGGFGGGQVIEAMVTIMDLFPTLLGLAGVLPPADIDGRDLGPLVRGEVTCLRQRVFLELTYHAAYDPMRGVRTPRYKYIRSFEPRPWWFPPNIDGGPRMQGYTKDWFRQHRPEVFERPRPPELLFDLTADPLEQHNLADDPAMAGVLATLRQEVAEWMARTDDPLSRGPVPPPPGARVTPPESWDP